MHEERYQPLYVGFYWTLPLPWKGFTKLSSNVEEAAAQSRTIQYQRMLASREASANNGRIVDEIVYMDVDPEHSTHYVKDALDQAKRSCENHGARLLWVDFSKRSGWRGSIHLLDYLKISGLPNDPIFPDNLKIGTEDTFNPVLHFRKWRDLSRFSTEHRRQQVAFGLSAALESIPPGYGRIIKIRDFLNELGILTPNGKPWTEDNVRKAVTKFTSQEASAVDFDAHLGFETPGDISN